MQSSLGRRRRVQPGLGVVRCRAERGGGGQWAGKDFRAFPACSNPGGRLNRNEKGGMEAAWQPLAPQGVPCTQAVLAQPQAGSAGVHIPCVTPAPAVPSVPVGGCPCAGHLYDGAVMITASHLPVNRNGAKFCTADVRCLPCNLPAPHLRPACAASPPSRHSGGGLSCCRGPPSPAGRPRQEGHHAAAGASCRAGNRGGAAAERPLQRPRVCDYGGARGGLKCVCVEGVERPWPCEVARPSPSQPRWGKPDAGLDMGTPHVRRTSPPAPQMLNQADAGLLMRHVLGQARTCTHPKALPNPSAPTTSCLSSLAACRPATSWCGLWTSCR